MEDESEHFMKLSTARDRVIAECRKLAALSKPHRPHGLEGLDEGHEAVQNTIDEINRLLSDEAPNASGKLLSFPIRTLRDPETMKADDGSRATQSVLRSTATQLRTWR